MQQREQMLQLKPEWAGFDLVMVGGQAPVTYPRDGIVIVSGCITTTAPTKHQAGWRQDIGGIAPTFAPRRTMPFLAPTSMSRYEGIYQCGTSMMVNEEGRLKIYFTKHTQPMVLHLSGLCFCINREESLEFPVAQYSKMEWASAGGGRGGGGGGGGGGKALLADEKSPLALQRCGNFVFLQGQLQEAPFGPTSQLVAQLPQGFRPLRELRCLAALIKEEDVGQIYDQTVAVTIRTDGKISVQGGKVHQVDNKGLMKVYQQNKKGMLNLEGIRFSLVEGEPIELAEHLKLPEEKATEVTKAKLSYLLSGGAAGDGVKTHQAVVVRQGDVCLLEGFLSWSATKVRAPNAKRPLATLPKGSWPKRRECFFTRGGSDLEERRRVDIDVWGRVFCPEGVTDGRVELTGIIFVAADRPPSSKLRDPDDWDDLKLQYQRADVGVASTSFDGHELLEAFVKRSNYFEWAFVEYDFTRHANRRMLLPLGANSQRRGHPREDMQNLKDDRSRRIWKHNSEKLNKQFGITTFYTLLHVSDDFFKRIVTTMGWDNHDARFLEDYRAKQRRLWATTRAPGLTYQELERLATEIADQMFDHWDFKAQLQGALENDFRPPTTIEHLFPSKRWGAGDKLIRQNIKDHEMSKFEEIRQFFYLYETTGANMTHCSLLGASDTFSTTGKWHFPDSPEVQRQLFENIEWLFPRKMYLYMSERQTQRFPFIEDFDVQAPMDYTDPDVPEDGKPKPPPDFLIMTPPKRNGNEVYGDPGELMKWRAKAVHMVYPHIEKLEAMVYSASGTNKGKEMLKSSYHLVWPQLIVDPDRAPVIRHVTLGLFRAQTMTPGSYLQDRQRRLIHIHDSNSWELVFDSTTINARNGLRLPYSDKASSVIKDPADKQRIKDGLLSKTKAAKIRVREGRPSVAVGIIEFTFRKDPQTGETDVDAKWIADQQSHKIADWIGFGTCRRDPTSSVQVELTPWQLGPEVLKMLPMKDGQMFSFAEGEDDGEGGHWVTHRPFPQIRRAQCSVEEFRRSFDEALLIEQEELQEEQNFDFRKRVLGTWIMVNEAQGIWRSASSAQMDAKAPDHLWHRRSDRWRSGNSGNSHRPPEYCICRPTEVVYLRAKGKVIIDGPADVVEALLRPLKTFTKPDDNAVMPIYDVVKMSH